MGANLPLIINSVHKLNTSQSGPSYGKIPNIRSGHIITHSKNFLGAFFGGGGGGGGGFQSLATVFEAVYC